MIVIYCLFFCKKISISFYKRILVSVCLWGFIRAKSCVARCRQLCARSSCEHAARAASQPVWVKPKSFQIPVPLKLDFIRLYMFWIQGPPISGTSETEKWDPYKIPTLKLGFPGISPFLNVSLDDFFSRFAYTWDHSAHKVSGKSAGFGNWVKGSRGL